MKSPNALWNRVALELATRCCTSATRDCKTVSRRLKTEGMSFLTITLPTYGKDFQKSLDLGYVGDDLFRAFGHGPGGLPRFLEGFLHRVFNRDTGQLLDDPCIESIHAIRQLTLMYSKFEAECAPHRVQAAFDGFIKCEKELRESDERWINDQLLVDSFLRVSSLLYGSYFTKIDREVFYGNHVPKHGPGATADKLRGNSKYQQRTWPSRLEKWFPVLENVFPSWSYYSEAERVQFLEPGSEIPVKVISVPKTLKTPRIIAVEPTAMQYTQQSLLELFVRHKKDSYLLDAMIGIEDQEPNQLLAREGSLTGSLATLDLSEASDRVSNQLVRLLLSNHDSLAGAVDACRSRKADVPGYGVIRLAKFASMGSALTFPIEALVFLTICFMGIERELNCRLTWSYISKYADRVRVYGDDIIVPTDCVHHVAELLETFGFRVNSDKSFWNGKFRESCGKEYYDGTDVSIVKCRGFIPTRREQATEVIQTTAFRNHAYQHGLWNTCAWLDMHMEKVLGLWPRIKSTSPVLGRHSFLPFEDQRRHKHYQSPLVKGYVVDVRIPSDPLDDVDALTKFFLKRGGQPSFDEKHLERAGRPRTVNIKTGWFSPF